MDNSVYRDPNPRHRLIVALDLTSRDEALAMVERIGDELSFVKVGMELYTAAGPGIVEELRRAGLRVFLDLKFHDIPNTMAGGVRSAAALGVDFCTIHAMAGRGVAAAAEQAAEAPRPRDCPRPPAVLAVTVLTSHSDEELSELFLTELSTRDLVVRLAEAATLNGATGLVASSKEIVALRHAVGEEPLLVIPGIRPAGSARDDQDRVATPTTALSAGADYLVVGRPITTASDPAAALSAILDEMAGAM